MALKTKSCKSRPSPGEKAKGERSTVVPLLYLVFAIGLITLPAVPYAGDPVVWREEARSLVLHGTLSIDPAIAQHFGEPGQFYVLNHQNGRYYSKYGLLNSLLTTIPLAVEYLLRGDLPYENPSERIFIFGIFYVLVAVAIASLLHEITGYYTSNRAARITYVLLVFYTTYLWYYLRSTSVESILLLCFLAFYLLFLRLRRRSGSPAAWPRRDLYGPWLAIALLTQTRLYFLLLVPIFVASLAWIARSNKLPRSLWIPFALRAIILPTVLIIDRKSVV